MSIKTPQLNASDAVIQIKNLGLRTFVGIKAEELTNKQDIVINVAIHYSAGKARMSEEITNELNYRTITKQLIDLV